MFKKITVVGLGYIGLPTASLLATKGFMVQGCDVSPQVVETINRGDVHIEERDLDLLVKSAVNSGHLKASLTPEPADVFIIAVPTPFKEGHSPDLSYIEAAAKAIAPQLQPGNLVILESTSPVGTTEKLADWLDASTKQIYLAHCPERVLPGQIIRELVDNDRIIGGIDPASAEHAKQFYQQFVNGEILLTNARTAELAKLVENAYRDVNIAFANELSMICEQLDIDVWELIQLANRHPRVNILQPGPGVGGHCIAVDPWFIVDAAPQTAKLIKTAREVNNAKPETIIAKVTKHAKALHYPVIACLGLAYKANIDDLRESPALAIVEQLAQLQVGKIMAVEPHIDALPGALKNHADNVCLASCHEALQEANIIVLLVDHQAFADLDHELLQEKIVIDTRGLWR